MRLGDHAQDCGDRICGLESSNIWPRENPSQRRNGPGDPPDLPCGASGGSHLTVKFGKERKARKRNEQLPEHRAWQGVCAFFCCNATGEILSGWALYIFSLRLVTTPSPSRASPAPPHPPPSVGERKEGALNPAGLCQNQRPHFQILNKKPHELSLRSRAYWASEWQSRRTCSIS